MKTINLVRQEKSEVDYKVIHFPDGEDHIVLDEIDRKESYSIDCRICNPNDLFILAQVADILDRQEVEFNIRIYYLMSMRMDRIISFNEAFSLEVVMNVLIASGATYIYILCPHSNAVYNLKCVKKCLGNCIIELYNESFYDEVFLKRNKNIIVFPDKGAWDRYGNIIDYTPYITCSKVRDPKTGKLLSFEIEEDYSEKDLPLLVVDDLCDGGGTFVGIAELLREKYPNRELNIFVTHMVNPKGIRNLADNYDNVTFTNSYYDWQNEILPKNVKVIEVV